MSLLNFTTTQNDSVSINTKYIVLVYPGSGQGRSITNPDAEPYVIISDVSGSRSAVKGTYEGILGYIRDES